MKMKMKIIICLILTLMAGHSFAKTPTKEELQAILKSDPENQSALYNLGLLNMVGGTPENAIAPFTQLEKSNPSDWKLKSLIIQAYSASGQSEKRDERIKELLKFRQSGKYPELLKKEFFVRDRFKAGDFIVYTIDYYDMKASWHKGPMAWKFYLTKNGKSADWFISFGSDDMTTNIAREVGKIGKNDRLFTLDGYWANGSHATYGMYETNPKYDIIKAKVIKILKGEERSLSSSNPGTKKAK